jgi:hypothetical protein
MILRRETNERAESQTKSMATKALTYQTDTNSSNPANQYLKIDSTGQRDEDRCENASWVSKLRKHGNDDPHREVLPDDDAPQRETSRHLRGFVAGLPECDRLVVHAPPWRIGARGHLSEQPATSNAVVTLVGL